MQKELTRLLTPFTLAAALTGVATTRGFEPDTCKTWVKSSTPFLFFFGAHYSSISEAATDCKDGKVAAAIALTGRKPNGKLDHESAKLGVEFSRLLDEKTNHEAANENEKKYYRSVGEYYRYYLFQLGGVTPNDVQKAALENKKNPTQNAFPSPCTGTGIKRSCEIVN